MKKRNVRAAGLSAGAPQIVAFTYEEALTPHWRLQGNVGTLILVSSLNARMLWFPQTESVVHLYMHAGVGFFHAIAMDYGNPDGGSPYLWFGAGFRVKAGSARLFFEVSRLTGMSVENNFDRDITAPAVGLLWEW